MDSLSIIIPCRDEADIIAEKVANSRALRTGGLDVEILVADDHSCDDSAALARAAGARVISCQAPPGKWNAVAHAARHARGTILCVTDADAIVDADAILPAMEMLRDQRIGAVSGVRCTLRRDAGGSAVSGGGIYDRVRRTMMRFYSAIDSTPTLHGPLMFVRRDLLLCVECRLRADDIDVPMQIRLQGFATKVCERSGFMEIEPVAEERDLHARRRAVGVVQAYWEYRSVLFSRRLGLFGMIAYPMEFLFFLVAPLVTTGILPVAVAATVWDDIFGAMQAAGDPFSEATLFLAGANFFGLLLESIIEGMATYLFEPCLDDLAGMFAAALMVSDEVAARARRSFSIRSRMVQMVKAMWSYCTDPGSVGVSWRPQRRETFRASVREEHV